MDICTNTPCESSPVYIVWFEPCLYQWGARFRNWFTIYLKLLMPLDEIFVVDSYVAYEWLLVNFRSKTELWDKKGGWPNEQMFYTSLPQPVSAAAMKASATPRVESLAEHKNVSAGFRPERPIRWANTSGRLSPYWSIVNGIHDKFPRISQEPPVF